MLLSSHHIPSLPTPISSSLGLPPVSLPALPGVLVTNQAVGLFVCLFVLLLFVDWTVRTPWMLLCWFNNKRYPHVLWLVIPRGCRFGETVSSHLQKGQAGQPLYLTCGSRETQCSSIYSLRIVLYWGGFSWNRLRVGNYYRNPLEVRVDE